MLSLKKRTIPKIKKPFIGINKNGFPYLTRFDDGFLKREKEIIAAGGDGVITVEFFDTAGNPIGNRPVKLDWRGKRIGEFTITDEEQ